MKIWKISHGTDFFDDASISMMQKKNIVSIYPETKAKGRSSYTQGDTFLEAETFDLFYVCRSNVSIELIGMFVDSRPMYSIINSHDDWVDREYILIKNAVNPDNYDKSHDRWWSPKNRSTFIEVNPDLYGEFEEVFLEPVFEMTFSELNKIRYKLLSGLSLNIAKISDIQRFFHGLFTDNARILSELNQIDEIELKKLEYEYEKRGAGIEQQPVVLLRHEIINALLEKVSFDDAVFNDYKKKIADKFEKNVFQAWSYRGILYPLFFSKYKEDLEKYLERFIKLIQRELSIESITDSTYVHFDGAQNQGASRIWFAIYNSTYNSQKHAYQLFFEITENGFRYGLLHMDFREKNQTVLEKNLKWKELINEYKKHLEIIKNDNSKLKAMIVNYSELLLKKGQIILQGPPGTGKTYTAKDIAEMIILKDISPDKDMQKNILDKSNQFKLIQFHLAYTYEDFVRGISAKPIGDKVIYQAENRTIGEFSKKALSNFLDHKKDVQELSYEKWSRDLFDNFKEIVITDVDTNGFYVLNNTVSIISVEDDAFRYCGKTWKNEFRMKFEDIILLFINKIKDISEIKKQTYVSGLARTHSSYFKLLIDQFYTFTKNKIYEPSTLSPVPLKQFVLIIDEINRANLPAVLGELIYALEYRGQSVESMYDVEGEGKNITIPPNLFIIGTMNTADRSVGHIDYAIRRRFAFIDILPTIQPIKEHAKSLFKNVAELFIKNFDKVNWSEPVLEKSEYLAPDFRPEDVWIGHSYFITKDEGDKGKEELVMKLKYEIKPILKEYLKDGILSETAKEIIEKLNV